MRLELAIESSSRSASVAARAGGRVLQASLSSTRAHASDLLPALDGLVRELGLEPREVEAVYVGLGPGSYTGLRVGIATALGIARSSGAALLGVGSFEVLLWERLALGETGGVLLDGRSGARTGRGGRTQLRQRGRAAGARAARARSRAARALRPDAAGRGPAALPATLPGHAAHDLTRARARAPLSIRTPAIATLRRWIPIGSRRRSISTRCSTTCA